MYITEDLYSSFTRNIARRIDRIGVLLVLIALVSTILTVLVRIVSVILAISVGIVSRALYRVLEHITDRGILVSS